MRTSDRAKITCDRVPGTCAPWPNIIAKSPWNTVPVPVSKGRNEIYGSFFYVREHFRLRLPQSRTGDLLVISYEERDCWRVFLLKIVRTRDGRRPDSGGGRSLTFQGLRRFSWRLVFLLFLVVERQSLPVGRSPHVLALRTWRTQ